MAGPPAGRRLIACVRLGRPEARPPGAEDARPVGACARRCHHGDDRDPGGGPRGLDSEKIRERLAHARRRRREDLRVGGNPLEPVPPDEFRFRPLEVRLPTDLPPGESFPYLLEEGL